MNTRYHYPSSSSELSEPVAGADAALPARAAGGTGPATDLPRLVIRGESYAGNSASYDEEKVLWVRRGRQVVPIVIAQPKAGRSPFSALTDYLNCTFPTFDKDANPSAVAFGLAEFFGEKVTPAIDRGRGLHGYTHSYDLGVSSALLAYGGQRGTALLSFPGLACALVKDWQGLRQFLEDHYKARITRWDGAVDDFEGKHSVDSAVKLFKHGAFGSGGRRPSCEQRGNWIEPDGNGRTFYVGKRENGKMLRVYDKGMQLGVPWHPWTRWEVEMHNRDRVIPWDVLEFPGHYVVGAFPQALRWAQKEMRKIKTLHEEATISYDVLAGHAARSYGKLISVMLKQEGSPEAVIDKLKRQGIPARLEHPAFTTPGGGLV